VPKTGFAGRALGGELPDMAGGCTSHQAALMLQHQFSSTLRETLNAQFYIVSACDVLGEALRGKRMCTGGTIKAATDALSCQTGNAAIFAVVKA